MSRITPFFHSSVLLFALGCAVGDVVSDEPYIDDEDRRGRDAGARDATSDALPPSSDASPPPDGAASCEGVVCASPPPDRCIDENTARIHEPSGTCSGGDCSYSYEDIDCPCEDGVCKECRSDSDCGGGHHCADGSCSPCITDLRCGERCEDCTESGTLCSAEAGACVECLSDGDCGGKSCDLATNRCEAASLCQAAIESAQIALANHSGWTHAKMDGVGSGWNWDFWQYGDVTSGPGSCHSGGSCWATNLSGNYINCQRADLRTPSMDLSACADEDGDIQLVFWHWHHFWSASYGGAMRYDGGLVEISHNGGATWQAADIAYPGTLNINPNMGSSYACTRPNEFYVHNQAGFVGQSGGWREVHVTIPRALLTSQFRVRFAYGSGVSSQSTSQTPSPSRAAPGWYLDGVTIEAR